MKRFNEKGRLVFPCFEKGKEKEKTDQEEGFVIEECYCQNGHSLISPRAVFNEQYNGIVLKVKYQNQTGTIFLSPVCGSRSKITLDIHNIECKILELCCPECDTPLPKYGPCTCGGELVTIFLDKDADFSNCIAVCNRYGCPHAEVRRGDELRRYYMTEDW